MVVGVSAYPDVTPSAHEPADDVIGVPSLNDSFASEYERVIP